MKTLYYLLMTLGATLLVLSVAISPQGFLSQEVEKLYGIQRIAIFWFLFWSGIACLLNGGRLLGRQLVLELVKQ
jgi:hypothetical protein